MTVATIKVRGEDIRAGQYVVLNNRAFRVLRNHRSRRGGDGALKLRCQGVGETWRGYECRDTFQVAKKVIKK
jgi:translation elongation factor P/translation initiation factor 5A